MNINDSQIQLTLDLEPNLADRFRSLKEAVAAGVYKRSLKQIAGDLDVAPGNLSVMLSDDGQRHFDLNLLEAYIQETGDKTPIHYLVAKYCGDRAAEHEAALERVHEALRELPTLIEMAGVRGRRGRK